jgi:thiamine biosynthesis lipoprotein
VKLTRLVMGMPVTVEVVGSDEQRAAIGRVFNWFEAVDRRYSTYKPDSDISRLNRGELARGQAPAEVREVLAACEHLRDRTNGYFDALRPDGRLDPSGYIKGWSIARAGALLDSAGLRNYCIEAGGDILISGHNADRDPWRVGIRHPGRRHEIVKVLRLNGGAVATSGAYERGEHIYDPHTGAAAKGPASVTVVGSDIAWTDAAATAAFAMGARGAEWLARQPGLECYVIGHDEQASFTPGLVQYSR